MDGKFGRLKDIYNSDKAWFVDDSNTNIDYADNETYVSGALVENGNKGQFSNNLSLATPIYLVVGLKPGHIFEFS